MRKSTAKPRHGVILPLSVIVLVLMIGMVAFAVDVGYLNLARTEIQTAADAGAMAGALALPDGPDQARVLAQTGAQANSVAGSPVVIVPEEDIEVGFWNDRTYQFTPLAGSDLSRANSVRVTCRRTASRGNSVPLFFARVFGVDSSGVSASAVARRRTICGVFIGIDSVDLNGLGAYTDSYNSDRGSYGSQTPGDRGHLCSDGPIDVQNGVVEGNAKPGAGFGVIVGSQGNVTGTTTPRTEPLSVPSVDFGDVATNNDNDQLPEPPYNSTKTLFKHNGGELDLPGGTYYFTDVSISGGPINVNEAVTIYVKGDFATSGQSIVNNTGSPSNLRIFAEGKDVKISGDSGFSGLVYAPSSNIEVTGGGEFYGAAIGKTLKFHNDGGIHADEAAALELLVPGRPRLVD